MKTPREREAGALLIEMMFGLTILSVGLLGFLAASTANFRGTESVENADEARIGLENVVETLRSADFSTVYQNYNGRYFEVPGLTASYTYSGVTYTYPMYAYCYFYTSETWLPAEFGPVYDLDGDGAMASTNITTNYKLLPALVWVTYMVENHYEWKVMFLMLGDYT